VLFLHGDVDVLRADQFVGEGETMLRANDAGQRFTIDMSGVDFIDSSGLSGLLRLRRTAQQQGIEVWLRGVPEHVAVLLRLSGLEQVLPCE
jgi:anti-sigma B factor antagonist